MAYNFEDVKSRLTRHQKVSAAELAALLLHDQAEMLDIMVINNPANVNHTLRHIVGMRALPFQPDVKKLLGQINGMVLKNDTTDLQKVVDNFKFDPKANNFTTEPSLVEELMKIFPNWF